MDKVEKWSPLRIPDGLKQYASESADDGTTPLDDWDPQEWNNPESTSWKQKVTPSHMGQWLILFSLGFLIIGGLFWTGQFRVGSGNPWVLTLTLVPAAYLVGTVLGREKGFSRVADLEWTFVKDGNFLRVLPCRFVERFGDAEHVKVELVKSRSYGAYTFDYVTLADLDGDRDKLMAKAYQSGRGPNSRARALLPGPLTSETSDTVLGTTFGVSGGADYHDNGSDSDIRFSSPDSLHDDVAADVLQQLQLYDERIIPQLREELSTLEIIKERHRKRAVKERDPELDRMMESVEQMSKIMQTSDVEDADGRSTADEVTENVLNELRESQS